MKERLLIVSNVKPIQYLFELKLESRHVIIHFDWVTLFTSPGNTVANKIQYSKMKGTNLAEENGVLTKKGTSDLIICWIVEIFEAWQLYKPLGKKNSVPAELP